MVAEILSRSRPQGSELAVAREVRAPVALHVVAELLRGLNREQRAAVTHGDGPLLVTAGPGTGKTEVITRRIAWLIASKRARPREILGLTFTDNAAEEMQARVDVLVPYGHADAAIHTFHAFGDRLLREHAFELGLPGDLRLVSRAEAVVLLRENLFDLGLARYRPLGNPTRFLGALVDLFQRAKDEDVEPSRLAEFAANGHGPDELDLAAAWRELANAYVRYVELMTRRGLIDHGDQVALALRLLRERPAVRDAVARKFRYVLVDEFQDMNRAQVQLLLLLTRGGRNLTVVGDSNQAIYRFRGAAGDNIAQLAALNPDLRRLTLRRNYRSGRPIIDAAARLAAHLGGDTGGAGQVAHRRSRRAAPVRSIWFGSPEEEADGVAQQIAAAVHRGGRPRDFAVLTRSNGEVESVARSIRARGLAVRTQLPADFFAQPAVRPLLAFLRVVADPHTTLELYALATSAPYGMGGPEMTDLLSTARRRHRSLWEILLSEAQSDSPAGRPALRLVRDVSQAVELSHQRPSGEVLYHHLRASGILARLVEDDAATEARAVARFFEIVRSRASLLGHDRVSTLVPHLDALIEANDELADTGPLDLDAVSVLTVHRAKGLEFPTVFVTGLVDGRFPSRGRPQALSLPWAQINEVQAGAGDDVDEERRLFYVAMTRARDELWLSHHVSGAAGRGRRRPSPFIAEALDTPAVAAPIGVGAVEQIHRIGTATAVAVADARAPAASGSSELSFSEIETYIDCPERYRLRHVVGVPAPPHHALTYGSALHRAVAAFHLSRAKAQPLTETELLADFAAAWSPEGFMSREHEEARFSAGQAALRRFREEELAAPSNVVAVERPFVFKLHDLRIRGRMDRIDRAPDGDVIVDYKSSDVTDQAKADEKARDSLQLQVYAMAHESETGSLPLEMRLHFLDSGVVGATRPQPERLDKARDKVATAAAGIRAGEFTPRPNPVTCGYCPYRQLCRSSAA